MYNSIAMQKLSFLKPKVCKRGVYWCILKGKHSSSKVIFKNRNFKTTITFAVKVFQSRIVGRAIRFENLRAAGVKEAQ